MVDDKLNRGTAPKLTLEIPYERSEHGATHSQAQILPVAPDLMAQDGQWPYAAGPSPRTEMAAAQPG